MKAKKQPAKRPDFFNVFMVYAVDMTLMPVAIAKAWDIKKNKKLSKTSQISWLGVDVLYRF